MLLTVKEKELVKIGASVATGCKPCTDFHFKKVREAGASDEEIKQAISHAMLVRDSAKVIMENHGLQHLGIAEEVDDEDHIEATTRIKELVSMAAAFAVNCTTNLKKHLTAARSVDISEEEIESVLDAALFIKGEAAYYVGQIAHLKKKSDELQQLLDELRETQALLVQSEKIAGLGKLVAGFLHELNTPIGALNGAADVSLRSVSKIHDILIASQSLDEIKNSNQIHNSLECLQDNHDVIMSAVERLTNVTKSLKSFARIDESELQKTNIHECLESTLTLLEHELKGHVKIEKHYGDIPNIYCYPGELNQVFMHILSNAIQAIRGKGTVSIQTFVKGANVHVEITDTGIGILPDKKEEIFNPNFTKNGSRIKAGLGLFTSNNIVNKHKGHIEVKSEVGKGSTFTVILPKELDKRGLAKEGTEIESQNPRCEQLKTKT